METDVHVLYSAANDPQTANDPQIGPQMIPDVDRKCSRRKTRNGMEFVPGVEVSIFNITRSKSELTIFYMKILNSHGKEFFG